MFLPSFATLSELILHYSPSRCRLVLDVITLQNIFLPDILFLAMETEKITEQDLANKKAHSFKQ